MIPTAFEKWFLQAAPTESTEAVAQRTLGARLAAVGHFLGSVGSSGDGDPQTVHQVRVWSRRAAAALMLYQEWLPPRRSRWIKKQLRRIRRAANRARDLDVLEERFGANGDATGLQLDLLRAQRAAAQKPIAAIHRQLTGKDRFARRCEKLVSRIRWRGPAENGNPTFLTWARTQLPPIVASVLETAPALPCSGVALHRFRIRAKKLRYAMELLAGAFPADFRDQLYPTVQTLQDKLGEINDLALSLAFVTDEFEQRTDAANGASQGWMRARRDELSQAIQDFFSWWSADRQERLRAGFEVILNANPDYSEPQRQRGTEKAKEGIERKCVG